MSAEKSISSTSRTAEGDRDVIDRELARKKEGQKEVLSRWQVSESIENQLRCYAGHRHALALPTATMIPIWLHGLTAPEPLSRRDERPFGARPWPASSFCGAWEIGSFRHDLYRTSTSTWPIERGLDFRRCFVGRLFERLGDSCRPFLEDLASRSSASLCLVTCSRPFLMRMSLSSLDATLLLTQSNSSGRIRRFGCIVDRQTLAPAGRILKTSECFAEPRDRQERCGSRVRHLRNRGPGVRARSRSVRRP